MRCWMLPLALWFMACAMRGPSAQLVPTPVPSWALAPKVADELASKYRETQKDSLSLEYMACLKYVASDIKDGERFYLILSVRFPEEQEAWVQRDNDGLIVNYRVRGSCDADELHLHTHSEHHCNVLRPGQCGTSQGWMAPSVIDLMALADNPLAFVQYGDRHLTGYWPDSIPVRSLRPPDRKRP